MVCSNKSIIEKQNQPFSDIAKKIAQHDYERQSGNRPQPINTSNKVTNKEFAKQGDFLDRCNKLSINPTKRQASKFRNKIRRFVV